ncbi:MAG TPA: hypothetical protein VGX92_11920 [Pyrinomonadaceae bacterium]|jgi:hypothetical protein|nr:hypothetical protein [Pyrinomonadaceae bacterium]
MDSNWTTRLNPEIVRSLRVTLPPRRLLFITLLTMALLLVMGGVAWNDAATRTYLSAGARLAYFGRSIYWVLTLVLFALLFVLVPATAALSFIQEKVRGTSLFQQMVLLSPFRLAVGKFIGSGLVGYFIAALIFPLFLIAAITGEADPAQFVRVSLFLLVGGLCCQAVGLFISAALSGPGDRFVRGGLLIGPAVGGAGALTAIALYRFFDHQFYSGGIFDRWNFYGVELEPYIVILDIMIFIAVWAFAGTVRRIKVSQLIPVRPWPAWLFFASAEAVVAGLLWGGYSPAAYRRDIFENPPVARLILYLVLNWIALMILAGSSALGRGRLREWWSAGQDELALFQRQEIKNAMTTFLVALGISLAGLAALWASFHTYAAPYGQSVPAGIQLAAIAACFTFTVTGMAVFIQYCAMQRFRIGAWAGVALTVLFYVIVGVIGSSIANENNTAALLNPLVYTAAITKDDPYMDKVRCTSSVTSVKADPYMDKVRCMPDMTSLPEPGGVWGTLIRGLIAEGVLALGCFGLACVKWRKTEEEILRERRS